MKFVKNYQVQVSVELANFSCIYDEETFKDNLDNQINQTIGFVVNQGYTEYTTEETIWNGWNSGFQSYNETDVSITVNVVYNSLDTVE
jgi:hypothetical protein